MIIYFSNVPSLAPQCTKLHLVAGLCPLPYSLGSLQHCLRSPSWIMSRKEKEGRGGKGKERGQKGSLKVKRDRGRGERFREGGVREVVPSASSCKNPGSTPECTVAFYLCAV